MRNSAVAIRLNSHMALPCGMHDLGKPTENQLPQVELKDMLMKTTTFKKTDSHHAALEESGSSTSSQRYAHRLRYKSRMIGRVSSSYSASLASDLGESSHTQAYGKLCLTLGKSRSQSLSTAEPFQEPLCKILYNQDQSSRCLTILVALCSTSFLWSLWFLRPVATAMCVLASSRGRGSATQSSSQLRARAETSGAVSPPVRVTVTSSRGCPVLT